MQHIKNDNTALKKDNTAGQKGTSAGTGATRRGKRATRRSAVLKRPRMNTGGCNGWMHVVEHLYHVVLYRNCFMFLYVLFITAVFFSHLKTRICDFIHKLWMYLLQDLLLFPKLA